MMYRGTTKWSCGLELAVRPRHRVVQAEYFADSSFEPLVVAVEWRETPDVDTD